MNTHTHTYIYIYIYTHIEMYIRVSDSVDTIVCLNSVIPRGRQRALTPTCAMAAYEITGAANRSTDPPPKCWVVYLPYALYVTLKGPENPPKRPKAHIRGPYFSSEGLESCDCDPLRTPRVEEAPAIHRPADAGDWEAVACTVSQSCIR